MQIRCYEINGFIKVHDKISYLALFDYNYCDKICGKIKCFITEKSGITDSINQNLSRIRNESYDSLPLEKIYIFFNVIILIKSVVGKKKNECYYKIFLEKGSNKSRSNAEYF